MNFVAISGNLVRDVELRFSPAGLPIGNLTVAVSRKWKGKDGELKEEVSFIGVVTFGKQAETVAQYFKKGSPIMVSGRLKQETWKDKDTGKERSKTVVVMDQFEFMGGKRNEDNEVRTVSPFKKAAPASPSPVDREDDSQDVPFNVVPRLYDLARLK